MLPLVPELLLVPAVPLVPEGMVDVEPPEAPMPDVVREDEAPDGVAVADVPPDGFELTDEPAGETLPLMEPPVEPMPEAVPEAEPVAPQAARAAVQVAMARSLYMWISLVLPGLGARGAKLA